VVPKKQGSGAMKLLLVAGGVVLLIAVLGIAGVAYGV
jgi:hypothetical protein